MRVIITFLGVFPKLTAYQHHGKSYEGEVFAQALRQFCQFERMLVCVIAYEWLSLAQKCNYFDQQRVSKIQEELRHLRNDLAHAGTDPRRRQDAKALQVQMQKIYQDLKALLGDP